MERINKSFEDQWSEAFSDAEIAPPEHVWASIDSTLANQAASDSKKRVIFFQWVAAASVVLALISGIALLNQTYEDTADLADTIKPIEPQRETENSGITQIEPFNAEEHDDGVEKTEGVFNSAKSDRKSETIKRASEQSISNATAGTHPLRKGKNRKIAQVVLSSDDIDNANDMTTPTLVEESEVTDEVRFEEFDVENFEFVDSKAIDLAMNTEPRVPDHLWLVPDLSAASRNSSQDFELWAGLSFGSGSFDPGTDDSGSASANNFAISDIDANLSGSEFLDASSLNPQYATGSSFSAGLDVGGRLANKVILSSGVHYNTIASGSTTNVVVTETSSNRSFALTNDNTEAVGLTQGIQNGELSVSSGTSSFNNTLQYLSIPLKAGYVLLDRKLNLILNSGVSTNILVGSNLNQPDDGLQNFGNAGSENNTFSSTYFDLLTSIQLGYNLKDKYLLSLEPNYRRAINNFTKSSSSIEGKPSNFGISIGVKYNF